ncbi:YmL10 [Podochytrium sp. JEL0797]|nr:YmL10 [Podochytrium sp. JEL0797]
MLRAFTRLSLLPQQLNLRPTLLTPLRTYVTPGPGSLSRRLTPPKHITPTITASSLKDNDGARKKKKRVGRGLGGGKGKTSGRGHKGYHARASKARPTPGFEGGQAGILRAIPKLGNHTGAKQKLTRVHLDTIEHWISRGRLNADAPIGIRELVASGCISGSGVKDGVVVLAKGGQFLRKKVDLRVTHASQRAIEVVEALGGSVTCFDYDRNTIRALVHPEKFVGEPKPEERFNKSIPARYFDAARRGYLANQVDQILDRVKLFKETSNKK